LRIPMRTAPLGLCAAATPSRNSPTQKKPIKDRYRIVASAIRCRMEFLATDLL
jgi:hypothetical protein